MTLDFFAEPIFWRATLAATCVAIVAGILGSFVVWRRLAYFGDTLAHSGLLGITLAILFSLPIYFSLGLVGAIIGLILVRLQSRLAFANDTLLGILSHAALAIGLLILGSMKNPNVNILGLLYGDILALSWQDVSFIAIGGIMVLAIIFCIWTPLLRITVHKSLAQVEGVRVNLIETIFILSFALSVAIAIKIVGVLLITALLIIPAASARALSKNPKQMAAMAAIGGAISVLAGVIFSFCFDIPTGPAIVVNALVLFILSLFLKPLLQ